MTEQTTRHPEPVCCFCGVRIGLRVAHFMSMIIIFGITTIINLLETDGMVLGMGFFFFLASIVGLSITFCRSSEIVRKGLYAYYTLYIVGLILLIVIWLQIGEKEIERIAGLKAKNPNLSEKDIEAMKKAYRTTIGITVIYQTVLPAIFFVIILNRTNSLRKWLEIKHGRGSHDISMSELDLIAFTDSGDAKYVLIESDDVVE